MKSLFAIAILSICLVGCGSSEGGDAADGQAAPPIKDGAVATPPKMNKNMPGASPSGGSLGSGATAPAGGAPASGSAAKPPGQ